MSTMRPTLKTIAQELGVSSMTVSLALKGNPRISAETRDKVLQTAEKLGYRTNPMVSSLMAHIRSSRPVPYQANLAFLSGFETPDAWKKFLFIGQAYEGIVARAKDQGYLIDRFWLNQEGMQGGRLEDILKSRNIQGVILSPLAVQGSLDHLDWSQWCSAALGDSLVHPRLHRVTHHQYHGMEVLLQNLARKGYRRIGLAVDKLSDNKVAHAWSSYMAGYNLRVPTRDRVPLFLQPEGTVSGDHSLFSAWLGKYAPDVVIGHDGLHSWLKDLKIRTPKDLAFAHLSLPSPHNSNFSGLDQNWRQIGAAAVDVVVAQIHRNERGIPPNPKTVLLEGFWVEGETAPDR